MAKYEQSPGYTFQDFGYVKIFPYKYRYSIDI